MNLLWPLAVQMMLALTGLTIIVEVVLGHAPGAILTRAALVLLGSGAVFSVITMIASRLYQSNATQEELSTVPKEHVSPENPTQIAA